MYFYSSIDFKLQEDINDSWKDKFNCLDKSNSALPWEYIPQTWEVPIFLPVYCLMKAGSQVVLGYAAGTSNCSM